jgi:hypothetical protein
MAYGDKRMPMKNAPMGGARRAVPKGFHRMPDGSLHTGATHTKSSRPISLTAARAIAASKEKKSAPRKAQSKAEARTDGGIPFGSLKEGALKRMLKVKAEDRPLTKAEMGRLEKVENGKDFNFRGNKLKMTPLMKKRVSLAETMIKFKKK